MRASSDKRPRAVVTGASSGIGRAVAALFAKRGHDVALLGRNAGALEETAQLVGAAGARAMALPCDVARADEVAHAAGEVLREWGAPRALVCSAGIVRRARVHEMREEDWDAVVDTNLKGVFLATRAFLGAMLAEKRGRVVVLGSISSTIGTPRASAYNASKWGVVGFVKSVAEELRGTGLQAMCVLPGSVDTPMLVGSGYAPQMTADDVANVVAYAALDAPDAMNGSAIEAFGS